MAYIYHNIYKYTIDILCIYLYMSACMYICHIHRCVYGMTARALMLHTTIYVSYYYICVPPTTMYLYRCGYGMTARALMLPGSLTPSHSP